MRKLSSQRHGKFNNSGRYNHVLDFIIRYKKDNDGAGPTVREIGAACGISSNSVVNYAVNHLLNAGLVYVTPNGHIGVTGGRWQMETVESVLSSPLPGTALDKVGSEPSRIVPFELAAQGLEQK